MRIKLVRRDTRKSLKRLPPASRRRVLSAAKRYLARRRSMTWARPGLPTLTRREADVYTRLLRPELSCELSHPTYQERRETAEAAAELIRSIAAEELRATGGSRVLH